MRTFGASLVAIFVMGAVPVAAQTAGAAPAAAPAPAPVAATPAPAAAPAPAPTPSAAPAAAPAAVAQPPVNAGPTPEEIAALREEYETLRQREAAVSTAAQPATAQTMAELDAVRTRMESLEATLPLETWKQSTLAFFMEQMRQAPPALPTGVPPDLKIEPGVVQLADNTVLYSAPDPAQGTALKSSVGPTPVLRIAKHGPMMMIWTADVGFAYVVSQFVEVFE